MADKPNETYRSLFFSTNQMEDMAGSTSKKFDEVESLIFTGNKEEAIAKLREIKMNILNGARIIRGENQGYH